MLIFFGVEQLFVITTVVFGLNSHVGDAIFFLQDFGDLIVNHTHLAQLQVVAIDVGGEDDAVFVNLSGMDVVDTIDALNLHQIVIDTLEVQFRCRLHQDSDRLFNDRPGFTGNVE